MRLRLTVLLALAGLATFGVLSSTALADGGQTIATAAPATIGQEEFGNTANGGIGVSDCSGGNAYRSWWEVNVTAGDVVTVNWGTQSTSMYMTILPEGTTDYTLFNVNPIATENVNSNYANTASYTVPQDGSFPFEFKSDTGCFNPTAPYDFTVTVQHGVVLALPSLSTLPLTGSATVKVDNPDGVAINDSALTVSLEIEAGDQDSFTSIGSATVSNGAAVVNYTIPAALQGQTATIEAASAGTNYVPATTATQQVKVTPPPCVVPAVSGPVGTAAVEAALRAGHCTVGVITHTASTAVADGDVVSLTPASGTDLPEGTKVGIVVSAGAPCVVPAVGTANSLHAVKMSIRSANCRVGKIIHQYSKVRRGLVITLRPSPGTSVAPKARVTVVVSNGRRHRT
jgi:hypothetical protein